MTVCVSIFVEHLCSEQIVCVVPLSFFEPVLHNHSVHYIAIMSTCLLNLQASWFSGHATHTETIDIVRTTVIPTFHCGQLFP